MKRILPFAALLILAAGERDVPYPQGFRTWTHVSSAYLGPTPPPFARFEGLHHIYANPAAMTGYRGGAFPVGAVIVFDLHAVSTAGGAIAATSRKQLDVMEKTAGGWRFTEFTGDSRTERYPDVADCAACHAKAPRDNVFSRFVE